MCDRDLFPDDCHCGFEEQQRSIRRRIDDTAIFLHEYPTIFFSDYNVYMRGDHDGFMRWRLGVDPTPTVEETKIVMIREIEREKLRLVGIQDEEDDPNIFSIELDVLNEMLVMIKEYHTPPGFSAMKRSWENGSFYRDGRLKKGNAKVGYIIGEVVEFVSPSVEVEQIIDKYIKAIAVVETWQTEDRFIEAWENGVFGSGVREKGETRYVYLGWKLVEYIGVDHPGDERIQSRMVRHSVQFDRSILRKFWVSATNTVKAMLMVDCLDMWAYHQLLSGIQRPFRFGWAYGD